MNMNLQVLPSIIGISPKSVDYFRSELNLLVDETGLPVDERTPEELDNLVDSDTGLQVTVTGILKNTSFTRTDLYRAVLGLPLDDDSTDSKKQVRITPLSKKDVLQFYRELSLRLDQEALKYICEDELRKVVQGNAGLKLRLESISGGNPTLAEQLYATIAKYLAIGKIDLNLQ